MLTIHTLSEHDDRIERMSTQTLLRTIEEAVKEGETEFLIQAEGQHDIGGPLWNADGRKIFFRVRNPGQRVGSMALPGTEIVVEGSAPADVGWLNSGGIITVTGDAGDTAGHCAAGGCIYIGGRAGTRSGSLMKHDPLYPAPELWILQNTGSFSFEFMGGGTAVVCGCDCQTESSVLGERPCIGMVGGLIYVRGRVAELPETVEMLPLDAEDIHFLSEGLPLFLEKIRQQKRRSELSVWKQWHKIVPGTVVEEVLTKNYATEEDIRTFHRQEWIEEGIFSDVLPDTGESHGLLARGIFRLRHPEWNNRHYNAPCEDACPAGVATQLRLNLLREGKAEEALRLVLDYTPFPASVCGSVCPNLCMLHCTRYRLDFPIQVNRLGLLSETSVVERAKTISGKRVAVIGGGPAGLASAWKLARLGHSVTIFEREKSMGGKLSQVIPASRLNTEILEREIERIQAMGVRFENNYTVNGESFAKIREEFDCVVVSTGTWAARTFPWKGAAKLIPCLTFLKEIKNGTRTKVAKNVVVIGAGNAGVDCAHEAYAHGAEKVTLIDIERPRAFPGELESIKALGAEIVWPCGPHEITNEGVVCNDGRLFRGEEVILCTGEVPDTSFLPGETVYANGRPVPNEDGSILPGVFAAGDCIRQGLICEAIGRGNDAAMAVQAYLTGVPRVAEKRRVIPRERLSTAWFEKINRSHLPDPAKEYERCISCGTCRDCHTCETSCPERAIVRTANEDGTFFYSSDSELCIGCGVCAGLCPSGIWSLVENEPLLCAPDARMASQPAQP